MMSSVLGVDVGGTKVAVGPVDRAGLQLAPPLFDSSQAVGTAAFIGGLESTLRRALADFADFQPEAIGLACAGTVDHAHGVVLSSPNLPLEDVPLAGILEESLGIPVVLENDANAAVLGEAVAGAAAGLQHVVMLTLGTGRRWGPFPGRPALSRSERRGRRARTRRRPGRWSALSLREQRLSGDVRFRVGAGAVCRSPGQR